MATTISLSQESLQTSTPPECDQAVDCCWFEKAVAASPRCANRDSLICRKRRDDVFAPHERPYKCSGAE
ncbi:MAG: hypothetical protein LBS31_01065 [Candidatus Adiutrix sp.]|jgi:hypothetical protein|nr:hypothetical protein [Candidatus Adiutrix sp.]